MPQGELSKKTADEIFESLQGLPQTVLTKLVENEGAIEPVLIQIKKQLRLLDGKATFTKTAFLGGLQKWDGEHECRVSKAAGQESDEWASVAWSALRKEISKENDRTWSKNKRDQVAAAIAAGTYVKSAEKAGTAGAQIKRPGAAVAATMDKSTEKPGAAAAKLKRPAAAVAATINNILLIIFLFLFPPRRIEYN